MRARSVLKIGLLGLVAVFANTGLAQSPPFAGSVLATDNLRLAQGASVLRLQNVGGDNRIDLLIVRQPPGAAPRIETWERRDGIGRPYFGSSGGGGGVSGFALAVEPQLPAPAIDLHGLYIPGGTPGAARDLVVLTDSESGNLTTWRNRGPDTSPRFEALQAIDVPGARRLFYTRLVPIPPGVPGFVNLPLAIGTEDGAVAILRFDDEGNADVAMAALVHPGGARDVLYTGVGIGGDVLLTVGAGQPWLWWPQGAGWAGEPAALPGMPPGAIAEHGLIAEFDGNGFPELVLAFDTGEVMRWNGVAPLPDGPPLNWDAPTPVTSGIEVAALVEMLVGPLAASAPALVIAGAPESRVFVAQTAQPGSPFGPIAQVLPRAAAAAGDFGLGLLVLAGAPGGISIHERAGVVTDQTPVSVGWDSDEPLPVARRFTGFSLTSPVPSDLTYTFSVQWRETASSPWLPVGLRILSTLTPDSLGGSEVASFATGDRLETYGAGLSNDTNLLDAFRLIPPSLPAGAPAPLREPRERRAFLLPPECTSGDDGEFDVGACLALCFNDVAIPDALAGGIGPALAKSSSPPRFVDDPGMDLLRRFRGDVLAASAKGREYAALYRELSPAVYETVLRRPTALLDFAAARDAWLPAIASLVDDDGSAIITAEMLDRLDDIAQILMLANDPALADRVRAEYALLAPRTLAGEPMALLRERYEGLPTLRVFNDGFEPE